MMLEKLPVSIKTMRYVRPTIDFLFPAVEGLKDMEVQQIINSTIYKEMLELFTQLRQPDLITYISGTYEVKNNQRDVLSMTLIGLGDFKGAHPITVIKALSFDVKTGKTYELDQLFKPQSNYIERINEIIKVQIKERDIPLLGDFKGIRPNQDYYIADTSIVVYFQQVEISPYVVGFPYFPIPIYKLQDMIPREGLLRRMSYF